MMLAALGLAGTISAGSYVVLARSGRLASTRLTVMNPGGKLTGFDSYVGSTYNVGLWLDVSGPDDVQLVSARATELSSGLAQREAMVGRACDGREAPLASVGEDLSRKAKLEIHPLREPRLREADGGCWYLLLRFVPRRTGNHSVQTGEIVYRVGRSTVRLEFPVRVTYEVVHESGRDPREEPDVR